MRCDKNDRTGRVRTQQYRTWMGQDGTEKWDNQHSRLGTEGTVWDGTKC